MKKREKKVKGRGLTACTRDRLREDSAHCLISFSLSFFPVFSFLFLDL
jgi:hypothetical protein